HFFYFLLSPLPSSSLFPYTTLFRSSCLLSGFFFQSSKGVPAAGTRGRKYLIGAYVAPRSTTFPHVGLSLGISQDCGNRRRKRARSEEHTSELQSRFDLVCRLLLEKK